MKHRQNIASESHLENGVKVALVGPPHSGKSVLLQSLLRELGADGARLDVSHGDGEGQWLEDNFDNSDVRSLRRKTAMGKTGVQQVIDQLQTFSTPLSLLDVGGKIHEDNRMIASQASHAVVMGSEPEVRREYAAFAQSAGLDVVAYVDNTLDDSADSIATDVHDMTLHAQIGDLHRGIAAKERTSVKVLARTLAELATTNDRYEPPAEHVLVPQDMLNRLGRSASCLPEDIPGIYKYVQQQAGTGGGALHVNGRARSWEHGAIAFAGIEAGAHEVQLYSPDGYVTLQSGDHVQGSTVVTDSYTATARELTGGTMFMQFDLTTARIKPEVLATLQVPDCSSNDTVVISGRLPSWFAASVALSYRNRAAKIAYFVPGEDAPVVWARDADDRGSVVSL